MRWMDLENGIGARIAPLTEYALEYVVRCYNIHHTPNKSAMTPLDRMRGCVGKPDTCPFGVIWVWKAPGFQGNKAAGLGG